MVPFSAIHKTLVFKLQAVELSRIKDMKMTDYDTTPSERGILVARCHEIQVSSGRLEIPEFETIPEVGQAVRVALHIRGLARIPYEVMRSVASYYLDIPTLALKRILHLLAEVEFVRLSTEGKTINFIIPTVPYYEDMYDQLGEYAEVERDFNEAEQLALYLVDRLAKAPENIDTLRNESGAESKLFQRGVKLGTKGSYIISRRTRGRDILVSPTYFAENAHIFADAVAAAGATTVQKLLDTVRQYQGWPLALIEQQLKLGHIKLSPENVKLLRRLAQDGAVKPPSIVTDHAGENYFLFTPTPSGAALSPTKRDVYEKAMAIVAAVRQGQLLPQKYAIRYPAALINKLIRDLRLSKATTEAAQQYQNLVRLRIGTLIPAGDDYHIFEIIDTRENREALRIALDLVTEGTPLDMEIDEEARLALQKDQTYIESIMASSKLRQMSTVDLDQESKEELERIFLGGKIT